MRLIGKVQETRTTFIGRLSDGSDRQMVQTTVWTVTVLDDANQRAELTFDHDPSAQELIDALPRPTDLVPTRKADLEGFLQGPYERWQRWKTTRIEAQARSMAAAVVNALQAKEDAAWAEYAQGIQAWRTAP